MPDQGLPGRAPVCMSFFTYKTMNGTPEQRIQRLENQVAALTSALRLTITAQHLLLEETGHPQIAVRMASQLQALNSLK